METEPILSSEEIIQRLHKRIDGLENAYRECAEYRNAWQRDAQAAHEEIKWLRSSEVSAERLIDALDNDGETFIVFTDAWRDLSAEGQLAQAGYWLRAALRGLEKDDRCPECHDEGGPGPLDPCPKCNKYGPLPEGDDGRLNRS